MTEQEFIEEVNYQLYAILEQRTDLDEYFARKDSEAYLAMGYWEEGTTTWKR